MTHIICLHVENQQGVLARISGLFSGRGYNLESITAGVTADPSVTRITLACRGDDAVVEQIKKQLNRLIDVIKAQIMDVGHEDMTVELAGSPEKIDDLIALLQPYGIAEVARSGVVAMERSRKSEN